MITYLDQSPLTTRDHPDCKISPKMNWTEIVALREAEKLTVKKELPCSHYLSSKPTKIPDIPSNSLILGVCGADLKYSNPDDEGWLVSDFYAFNILLKGRGIEQRWLSPVSPADLVKTYGQFQHGNPYQPRKVVLSQKILDKELTTPPKIVPEGKMVENFFNNLKEYRQIAEETGAPIVVLLFGHNQRPVPEIDDYIIEYSTYAKAKPGEESVPEQLKFWQFHNAVRGLPNATMITPLCCSKIPPFKTLFDGTIKCPLTFVRQLSRSHLRTCLGDWAKGDSRNFIPRLRGFLEKDSPCELEIQKTYDYIEYRNATLELLDDFVDHFNLPRPFGKRAAFWDSHVPFYSQPPKNPQLEESQRRIRSQLLEEGFYRVGAKLGTRTVDYMACAMALAGWDSKQVAAGVKYIKDWRCLREVQFTEEEEDLKGWVLMDQKRWYK